MCQLVIMSQTKLKAVTFFCFKCKDINDTVIIDQSLQSAFYSYLLRIHIGGRWEGRGVPGRSSEAFLKPKCNNRDVMVPLLLY